MLLFPVLIPLLTGLLILLLPRKSGVIKEALAFLAAGINAVIVFNLLNKEMQFYLPWAGFGIDLSFKLYQFNSFILAAAGFFTALVCFYAFVFMRGKNHLKQFYSYLLFTLSFVNGAVLSDNLIVLLFFWEGLLLGLFAMIAVSGKSAFKTAIKAFTLVGIADLCMLAGVALTCHLAGTAAISEIRLVINPLSAAAFILLFIGAAAKAGAMPFHSWIPDAALDAPLPFMALLPGALEKILGIYVLSRIVLDMFALTAGSGLSVLMMIAGAITIIAAVMMALVQKDYKRLLSYHAISQVGYMILGIGTAVPVGIIGGIFHMINNALYKSCLFLTGGSVEHMAGTTDLEKLGAIGKKMPVTFACFFIAALSISGVPPFNGFFSKELLYDAALGQGIIFYLAALVGSFFTAVSFLKLGHAAYLGKTNQLNLKVKEAPLTMLIPMIILAGLCVLFGLNNALPLEKFIQPVLGERLAGHDYAGMPENLTLVAISIVVLICAVFYHVFGANISGSGLKAVDYFHHGPLLAGIYKKAEQRFFDPYEIGLRIAGFFAGLLWKIDRGIDWLYNNLSVNTVYILAERIKRAHTGNYVMYISWSLTGMLFVIGCILFMH